MRLLITGGLGFIGFNFLTRIANSKLADHIVVVDKVTYAAVPWLREKTAFIEQVGAQLITGDLNEIDLVSLIQSNGIDRIVNFAAESHVDNSIRNPDLFLSANINSVAKILSAMRACAESGNDQIKLIQISTDEVFGDLDDGDPPFSLTSAVMPRNPYSATKAAAEHLVKAAKNTYGLQAHVVNCCNNFGPYQHPEKLLPRSLGLLLDGEKVEIYGKGSNRREWIFVDDFCDGIAALLMSKDADQDRYLFGSDFEASNLDFIHLVIKQLFERGLVQSDGDSLIKFVEDRLGHDRRYAVDYSETTKVLKWRPKTSMEDGLTKTIDFYISSRK